MQALVLRIAPLWWLAALFAGFLVYGASGHDDPHINFWFSHTLLEYGELVNYNGDRVQQTTSLLLVVLVALFSKIFPFDLTTCGYLVDIFSSFACLVLVTRFARRHCPALALWPSLLVLASTSYLLWTFGGMGALLAALVLLLAAGVWAGYVDAPQLQARHYGQLAAVTLALMTVRPEMPLVIVATSAGLFVWHLRDPVRRARFLHIALASAAGAALLFLWQKAYFGSWLPLPVLAKQTGTLAAKLQSGFIYVSIFSVFNPSVLLVMLLAPLLLWFSWREPRTADPASRSWYTLAVVLLALTGVYVGFVLTAGGDWMQGGRFFVPVIPLAALLLVMQAVRALRRPWLARLLLLPLLPWSLYFTKPMVAEETHGVPVWAQYRLNPAHSHYGLFEQYNQEHLRDLAAIDHLHEILPRLHEQLGRPVRLVSGQAGMVFYRLGQQHFGKVHFYDLRGLVEGAFTLCPYLDSMERNPMGMDWSYEQFLPMLPELKQHCDFDPPDVVYDLNSLFSSFEPVFDRHGYAMLHQEEGFVIYNPLEAIPTNNLFVPNVIFVRKDLLPLLGNPPKRMVIYRDIPLVNRAEKDFFQRLTGKAAAGR